MLSQKSENKGRRGSVTGTELINVVRSRCGTVLGGWEYVAPPTSSTTAQRSSDHHTILALLPTLPSLLRDVCMYVCMSVAAVCQRKAWWLDVLYVREVRSVFFLSHEIMGMGMPHRVSDRTPYVRPSTVGDSRLIDGTRM